MRNKKYYLSCRSTIRAIYVVLTYFISAFNLASGAIQVRISEALLPFYRYLHRQLLRTFYRMPAAYNLTTGCMPLDVVFGSLATLIGHVELMR